MSERSAAMNRYREWQSGHWSGDKPEWDEVHGATEDAWLAAEQARADLAAERESKLVKALEATLSAISELPDLDDPDEETPELRRLDAALFNAGAVLAGIAPTTNEPHSREGGEEK